MKTMVISVASALLAYFVASRLIGYPHRPSRQAGPPGARPPAARSSAPLQAPAVDDDSRYTAGREDVIFQQPSCPIDVDTVPDDFIQRSPFRTREAMVQFLRSNGSAATALNRSLQLAVAPLVEKLVACYAARPDQHTEVQLEWTVRATKTSAVLSNGRIVSSGDDPALEWARECAQQVGLGGWTHSALASSGEAFAEYEGPYLRTVPLSGSSAAAKRSL
jgi:hypothetical protein